ncbi:uncharacterized protein PFLUO_LOCUS730 [Penicillium psychrofluorescens]|uniref:uncharacterized protein n=1 Tax=Penicillium psychrofluorescens TaxID=3158075 RepID=UPI003CCE533F
MSAVNVSAVLFPKADKVDEVIALVTEVVRKVQENEPDTLLYYAFRVQDKNEIVVVERYKNQAAVKTHVQSSYFKEFAAKLGPLADKPMELRNGNMLGSTQVCRL